MKSTYQERGFFRKTHRFFWVARFKVVNSAMEVVMLVVNFISELVYKDRSLKVNKIGDFIWEGRYES